MELKKYVNEIMDIASVNDVSWDVGMDMFIANVQNAGEDGIPYYPGASVDYAAMKPEWMEMTLVARAEEKNAFCDYVRANMDEIIAARRCV